MVTSEEIVAAPIEREPLAPSPPAPELGPREAALRERVAGVQAVLRIERAFGIDAARLQQVESLSRSVHDDLTRLLELAPEDPAARRLAERLDVQLACAEEMLLEVDARVPDVAFERLFGRTRRRELGVVDGEGAIRVPLELTPELITAYARLIAAAFDESAQRRERLSVLVQRLVTTTNDRGRVRVRPWRDVEALLQKIVPESRATAGVRSAAVVFFRSAAARVHEVTLRDELFDSGLYLDIVGYEQSLGPAILDATVLYAVAVLDAALGNKLAELVDLEGVSPADVMKSLEEAHASAVASIGAGSGDASDDVDAKAAELRKDLGRGVQRTRWKAPTIGALTTFAAVLVAVLAVAMFVGALRRSTRNANETVAMAVSEVHALSPILEGGSISRGEAPPVFLGRVAPRTWQGLTPKDRRAFAQRLVRALAGRGVRVAIVHAGETVVVEIMRGELVFVEGGDVAPRERGRTS
ncbi:hypothetical protein L6R52_27430 [Myxococcota bacterium]|nr:hypothetical protein [Myxococcota bacterium]